MDRRITKGELSNQEAQERLREAVDEMETVINRFNDTPGLKDEQRRAYLTRRSMSILKRTYRIDKEPKPESTVVSRQEITRRIAARSGLTQKKSAEVLEATLASIEDSLKKGHEVRLVGFGSFKVRQSAARKGVNPRSGQPLQVAAKNRVRFSPGKDLSDAVVKR